MKLKGKEAVRFIEELAESKKVSSSLKKRWANKDINRITELDLTGTKIKVLPAEIEKLRSLQSLYLYATEINELPAEIGKLSSLQSLYLYGTEINELPAEIGKLSSLQNLSLGRTKINELPPEIGNLKRLEKLDLSGLTLKSIPRELLNNRLSFISSQRESGINSRYINLCNTTLLNQPIDVFFQNDYDLIMSLYTERMIRVNEAKVIVLGDGEAGKTYLIKRLTEKGRLERDNDEDHKFFHTERTHGIYIKKLPVTLPSGNDITLSYWDFGGQQIMHSMHRVFLTQDTCYLVLIKTGTDRQMEQARYWLRTVESMAPKAQILILVNEVDQVGARLDENQLVQEFSKLNFTIRKLNVKKAGMEQILDFQNEIAEMAQRLDCCSKEIPEKWEKIRSEIRMHSEEKHIISQEDYEQICKTHDFTETNNLGLLTRLNNLGSCFSYHKDDNDKIILGYKILNPEWFTNALYMIIIQGQEYASRRNGLLTYGEIQGILRHPEDGVSGEIPFMKDVTYAKEHIEYILDIMHSHVLSFQTPEGDEFIPALCSENTPENIEPDGWKNANPDKRQDLLYELHYKYLPLALIHRLTIKWYGNLEKDKCWNKGMRINFKKDYAIIASIDENILKIRVVEFEDVNVDYHISSSNKETNPVEKGII